MSRHDGTPAKREELRQMAGIGAPVAVTLLCRFAMNLTDLAVLGHLSTDYLSAASWAQVLMEVTSVFMWTGFGSATNTLCAQAYGAGNARLVGLWFLIGAVLISVCCAPVAGLWFAVGDALKAAGVDARVARLAGTYAEISTLGLWPRLMFTLATQWLNAQKITRPQMGVGLAMVGVNLGLNVVLVHGLGSYWPGLGFEGSPIATVCTRALQLAVLAVVIWRHGGVQAAGTWPGLSRAAVRESLAPARRREYMALAWPLMAGGCLEEFQLEVITIMAGKLGEVQLSSHNALITLFFCLTSAMYGLTTASVVRLGHHLGGGHPRAARAVAQLCLGGAAVLGVTVGGAIALLRRQIGRLLSDDPEVWDVVERLATLLGATYAALALFYTAMSVLQGQARAVPVAVAFFVGAWVVGVPAAWLFAFHFDYGIDGLWYGLIVGYSTTTLIAGTAALQTNWLEASERAVERNALPRSSSSSSSGRRSSSTSRRRSKSPADQEPLLGRTAPSEDALQPHAPDAEPLLAKAPEGVSINV